jgi:hypothetical protein
VLHCAAACTQLVVAVLYCALRTVKLRCVHCMHSQVALLQCTQVVCAVLYSYSRLLNASRLLSCLVAGAWFLS